MDKVIDLIKNEEKRQQENLTLIPSENYASRKVREAVGSVLSNKYAEGYPGKRYYLGNDIVDQIEQIAIDRAINVFKVSYANVQAYSGSIANTAALIAMAKPGEKIMGMKLSAGGHLTHGHKKITFSGLFFESIQFDVDDEGLIDYEEMEKLAETEKPKVMIIGTTSYPRDLKWDRFAKAAEKAGAYLLADISHTSGLVAAGVLPSPAGFADVIMTTTHKSLRGPRGTLLMVTEKGLKKDPDLPVKIDKAVFPGMQGGPHENTIAGIAICLEEATTEEFKHYAGQTLRNAQALANGLVNRGLKLVTGGTDVHLMVVDLRETGKSGREAAVDLEKAGIVVNPNAVPHDTNPPMNPSGIRLGTPAVTTRGMGEGEMEKLAGWIAEVIKDGEKATGEISKEVRELCGKFPTP